MKTAKTNVNHIEQARADITFNGKKAIMTLDWEKPTRFYIHVRGMGGLNKVISEEHDPRAILLSWTRAMKKYGGELVARTPKQRDLQQKQHQLAADFRDSRSRYFAPSFLRKLRQAYLKDIRSAEDMGPAEEARKLAKQGKYAQAIKAIQKLKLTDMEGRSLKTAIIQILDNASYEEASPKYVNGVMDNLVKYLADRSVGRPQDVLRVKGTVRRAGKTPYQLYFDKKLKEWGIKSPSDLDDAKKKKFFDEVDKGWKGKNEKPEPGEAACRKGFGGRRAPRDPVWVKAKYPGVDIDGKPFKKGDKVLYWPNGRKFMQGPKAEQAWRDFQAQIADEIMYNAGARQGGDKAAYKAYFDKKMKEWGISSPAELDDAKKKKFFDEVDKGWKGESEGEMVPMNQVGAGGGGRFPPGTKYEPLFKSKAKAEKWLKDNGYKADLVPYKKSRITGEMMYQAKNLKKK